MPLFMDFHKFDKITIEDVRTAHIADLFVQAKYRVKYHQFWVNEEAGTVFCLMEGPDKESCESVHREAHGAIACAMTEVESGFYEVMMGKGHIIDHGSVKNEDGTLDLGYRYILVASVYRVTKAAHSSDLAQLQTPYWARKVISEKMVEFKGRQIQWGFDDSLIGVFNNASEIISCAVHIHHELMRQHLETASIVFRMGVGAAQPVTEKGDFFNDTIKLVHRLSIIAQPNQILISSLFKKLCNDDDLSKINTPKLLNEREEKFISNLLNFTEKNISDEDFTIDKLSNDICISRPQLYRKITSLTGRSPNDFIRDLRLDKALILLKEKSRNIAEIAFKVGFNSPSYFSKCFTKKFGCTPSDFARTNVALYFILNSYCYFLNSI